MKRIAIVSLLAGLLGLSACGVGASSSDCLPGQTCTCTNAGSCDLECLGAGCVFQCAGAGSCNLSCLQGGCTATSSGHGSLNLACPGGNCTVHCSGMGSCNIMGCPTCRCVRGASGTCNVD